MPLLLQHYNYYHRFSAASGNTDFTELFVHNFSFYHRVKKESCNPHGCRKCVTYASGCSLQHMSTEKKTKKQRMKAPRKYYILKVQSAENNYPNASLIPREILPEVQHELPNQPTSNLTDFPPFGKAYIRIFA